MVRAARSFATDGSWICTTTDGTNENSLLPNDKGGQDGWCVTWRDTANTHHFEEQCSVRLRTNRMWMGVSGNKNLMQKNTAKHCFAVLPRPPVVPGPSSIKRCHFLFVCDVSHSLLKLLKNDPNADCTESGTYCYSSRWSMLKPETIENLNCDTLCSSANEISHPILCWCFSACYVFLPKQRLVSITTGTFNLFSQTTAIDR